jgi:hypothetical protein
VISRQGAACCQRGRPERRRRCGYTIQRQRFENKARALKTELEFVRTAAGSADLSGDERRGLVNVIA